MKYQPVKKEIRDHLNPFYDTWKLILHDGSAETQAQQNISCILSFESRWHNRLWEYLTHEINPELKPFPWS